MKNIDSPWGHTTALSARTFVLHRLYPSTPAQPHGFNAVVFKHPNLPPVDNKGTATTFVNITYQNKTVPIITCKMHYEV